MKPIVPVLGVLSVLWILGGTWWLSGKVCGNGASTPMFSFTDGKFKIDPTDNYTFNYNSSKPHLTENTRAAFAKIVKHINKTEKQLTLSGFYATSEMNDNKKYDNLGIARAEAIKAQLVQLKGNSDQIITTSKEVNSRSFANRILYGGVDFILSENTLPSNENSDASEPLTSSISIDQTYIFNVESDKFKVKKTAELEEYMQLVQSYLNENSSTKVFITAYTDDKREKKNADNWARSVRSAFQEFGIAASQMKREGTKILDTAPDDRLLTRVEVKVK